MKESLYYYNLANGMSAVLDFNPNDNADIDSFIKLNDVKNNYWKAFKLSQEDGWVPPDLIVNLANVLKNNIVYLNQWIIMNKQYLLITQFLRRG